ncbi:unnamed protein product [Caenorhabditis angaria]|uniref:RING-type E3 ubiquitin transferase n=1 Tax=Caenorhabditis angaria TaxID=860376 RepID=A0A9P1IHT3_9PELO|nr:unnamed protein product [Caenorhabditis angaria]
MEQKSEEPSSSSNENKKEEDSARFECNICLDTAKDAVVSMCGHLFCWPCLSQWLETRPERQLCPVCKSAIDSSKVVPIYGRGGDSTDPRKKIPPRPKGQRTEAPPQSFPGFQWGGGDGVGGGNVHFSFGIGIFPLSFVASWFNTPIAGFGANFGGGNENQQQQQNQPGTSAAPGSHQYQEEEYLANIFKYIGIFMLIWLLFV